MVMRRMEGTHERTFQVENTTEITVSMVAQSLE